MIERLARLANLRARRTLLLAGVFFVFAGALGAGVADRLDPYGADDPDTESVIADEDEEDPREEERPARPQVREPCEPLDHPRSRSASRVHQSTNHSLDSIPKRSTTKREPSACPLASIARSCLSLSSW